MDGSSDIQEQISDFLMKIEGEVYLLECQSYDDGSMAVRIAEYAFIVARQFASWDIGHAAIPMPRFSIIYDEKEITSGDSIEDAVKDLEYFRDEMVRLHKEGALSDDEIVDQMGFVNTIVTHITNGNKNEERLVNIMGGTVIETESEKLIGNLRIPIK